jgi:exonuclease III
MRSINVTSGWWEHRRTTQAYNEHFDSGKESQVGGVSITVANSLAHRTKSVEQDPSGLGRWTSILIQGKQGFSTRIVCVYRPCKSFGAQTAYIQHTLHYARIGKTGDPRDILMDELAEEIIKWTNNGEQMIIVGDFNTGDKTTRQSQQSFWAPWLRKTSLIDVHKSRLDNRVNLPSTHERGSVPIDYIFASPSLMIRRAGFLPFAKFPGDHRAIWVET